MSFDASKYTKGKWMKSSDLPQGRPLVLTIKRAYETEFNDGSKRPVLEFLELDQHLVLNKTRVTTLIALFGANSVQWEGKAIELIAVPSNYQGLPTIAVRGAANPPQSPDVKFSSGGNPNGSPSGNPSGGFPY